MSYSDIVATIALLVSVFGTFASGYISYHYAIKGERRKEYNSVADQITLSLLSQMSSATDGKYPAAPLSKAEMNALLIVCPKRQKMSLRTSFDSYKSALSDSGSWESGRYNFHSPDVLIKGIDELLKVCERK
ncbi:hypothetical protein V6E05_01050 [Citrobacter freundii]|uniref:hypothetical protein n=1 Tax=Citrobacter freundii TaxID=546 RepID=UPI002FDA8E95